MIGSKQKQDCNRKRKHDDYKVVIEAVTQKKQKLQSEITYNTTPPQGHIFVPAGLARLTIRCKDVCRLRDLPIQIVSAENPSSKNPTRVSHHVHRTGYHFPVAVVETACIREGYRIRDGKLEDVVLASSADNNKKKGKRSNNNKKGDQIARAQVSQPLDTHSMDISPEQIIKGIRDLFPCIPAHDVHSISRHSFREGTARVGNCAQLPLARRIQLAVLAHIRHVYTNYDALLSIHSYPQARRMVENECLQTLIKWRGEDDLNSNETEDIFKEIIVLDDPGDVDTDEDGVDDTDNISQEHPNSVVTDAAEINEQLQQISTYSNTPDDSQCSPSPMTPIFTTSNRAFNRREETICSSPRRIQDIPQLGYYQFRGSNQADHDECARRSSLNYQQSHALSYAPASQPVVYSTVSMNRRPNFDFSALSTARQSQYRNMIRLDTETIDLTSPQHPIFYQQSTHSRGPSYGASEYHRDSFPTGTFERRPSCPSLRIRKIPRRGEVDNNNRLVYPMRIQPKYAPAYPSQAVPSSQYRYQQQQQHQQQSRSSFAPVHVRVRKIARPNNYLYIE